MLTYHIDLEPDPSGGFTATVREFPGCIAEGDDLEKALLEILDTATEWLPLATALGFVIPDSTNTESRLRDALEATRDRLSLVCGMSPLVCHTYAAALDLVLTDGLTFDAAMRKVTG